MNPNWRWSAITKAACPALLALWLAPQARAANFYVYMDEYGFDPAYLEVLLGDTVYWWNDDSWGDSHTTRSYTYPWSSGLVPWGAGVYLTVTKTGTFPYIDETTGETGTLVVNPYTPPQPTPATLSDATRLPDGRFQLTLNNLTPGATYIVQVSTNLTDWSDLSTNIAASSTETWTDNGAPTAGLRFYRTLHLQ